MQQSEYLPLYRFPLNYRIILGGIMALLIDGKRISAEIKDELKEEVAQLKEQGITGALAVIQVGNDPFPFLQYVLILLMQPYCKLHHLLHKSQLQSS